MLQRHFISIVSKSSRKKPRIQIDSFSSKSGSSGGSEQGASDLDGDQQEGDNDQPESDNGSEGSLVRIKTFLSNNRKLFSLVVRKVLKNGEPQVKTVWSKLEEALKGTG
jgi:hypothetical protein